MAEPDWEELAKRPKDPRVQQFLQLLIDAELPDLHAALKVIGWRLGVVSLESLEIAILDQHRHRDSPIEAQRAGLREYQAILRRLTRKIAEELEDDAPETPGPD